uniref:Peptidase A2 domain-containing protein n=1 Tax=Plectus sambesii TaxID=2011161 RepID=A0A914VGV8_9BILA
MTTGQVADLKTYQVLIKVNGHNMRLEFDTSAAATVISKVDWDLMGKPPLSTTRLPLKDFSGNRLKLKGQVTVDIEYEGRYAKLPMIVGSQHDSIIGRKWIRQLDMCNCLLNVAKTTITPQKKPSKGKGSQPIHALLEEFLSIFEEGLGHCVRTKAHLELKPNVHPKFIKARILPYAVHDAMDAKIDRLIAQGVLTLTSQAEWVAPVVLASKQGGKICLCANFSTGLNDALDVNQYPLPHPDNLYQQINGCCIFCKVDLSDAYL